MKDPVDRLCDLLRRYLEAHPDAADSVTGIRQWWLAGLAGAATQEELGEALERLVREGRMRRMPVAGGVEIYAGAGRRPH